MKKLLICVLACVLVLGLWTVPAYADTTGKITANSGLKLRKSASTSSEVLDVIPYGKSITILDTATSGGTTWYKTSYGGSTGWVSGSYVSITSEGGNGGGGGGTASGTGKTKANLNMRSGAGTSYSRITTIPSGSTVSVSDSKNVSGTTWYKVSYNGKTGWVSGSYLTVGGGGSTPSTPAPPVEIDGSSKGTVTASALTVRDDAGTSAAKIASLSKGTSVSVVAEKNAPDGVKWYRIKYGDVVGYVCSTYLKVTSNGGSQNTQPSTPAQNVPSSGTAGSGTVTADGLCMRSGPGLSYNEVTYLEKGDTVAISGQQTDNRGVVWYKVAARGMSGYVSSKYVRVSVAYQPVQNPPAQTEPAPTQPTTTAAPAPTTTAAPEPTTTAAPEPTTTAAPEPTTTTPPASQDDMKFPVNGLVITALNIRSGPGTTYTKVNAQDDPIPGDTTVELQGRERDSEGVYWYKVTYKNYTGYCSSKYIVVIEEGGDEPVVSQPGLGITGSGKVTTSGSALSLRKDAGTSYSVLASVPNGTSIVILDGKYDSEGTIWYKYSYGGKTGYSSSKYITFADAPQAGEDPDFEAYLEEQGFPDSYKVELRILHKQYPNWKFKAQHINESFDNVVYKQSLFGSKLPAGWTGTQAVSVVSVDSPDSWKSTESGAYDSATGTWVTGWDGGHWAIASRALIRYHMDPRNFLNNNDIFQFLSLSSSDTASASAISKAASTLGATWLTGDFTHTSDNTTINYPSAIKNACDESDFNAIALVCIMTQELGTSPKAENTKTVSGTVPGYEGYYNYINAGAYVDESRGFNTAYERGLYVAKNNGWNSRQAALTGAATLFRTKYVDNRQSTLYTTRFNVVNGTNSHQFSTDVRGAYAEGKMLGRAYTEDLRSGSLVFYIPVYKNMTSSAYPMP